MFVRALSAAMGLALAAAPAMARQRQVDPGNPFSKVYDFMAWSAWRARGSWDSRGSDACARNPLYSPSGTPTFKPIPFPNPSWF